jgi:hypothetical protein
MISNATVHKAMVLVNRRMKVERGVTTFGPVCSNVAGMALHHLEGKRTVQQGSESVSIKWARLYRMLPDHPSSTLLWIAPA